MGAETGLLDQLASLCSREAHVLRIDFRSLAVDPHPLDLGDWQLVTVDSGATHNLATGGYNERRAECRAACEALGITTLRDATTGKLDGVLERRVRHVVSENARVEATARSARRRTTWRPSPACSTSRTPRCATTTRRPCPRWKPRWSA